MKDAREKFITRFLCAHTNTKNLNTKNKIYSLLLHEDFYLILFENSIYFRSREKTKWEDSYFFFSKKERNQNPTTSFLQVKYIISKFRSNKFTAIKRSLFRNTRFQSDHPCEKNFSNFSLSTSELVFESIAFVFLCNQSKKNGLKNFLLKRNSPTSISIHKPLEFFERQWQYSSFGFQERTNFFFHPEISLRILRKNFDDISFLHLVRILVHSLSNSKKNTFMGLSFWKITNFLWNLYASEIDNFFVSSCDTHCIRKSKIFSSTTSSLSCSQKIHDWSSFAKNKNSSNSLRDKANCFCFHSRFHGNSTLEISFLAKSSVYKYFRSNCNWFFLFQRSDPWNPFLERSIINFFVRRLGYKISKNSFSQAIKNTSFFFLAYILQFSTRRDLVRINTKFFFLRSYFLRNILCFISPFDLIVLILSKYNYCNSRGLPRSKSGWVTWTDDRIIHHFNKINDSFFLYYSACQNRKDLLRIQYILYFSCWKTLASKHKSNLTKLSKKIGQDFRYLDFTSFSSSVHRKNYYPNSRFRFLYKNLKRKRIWNLHLLHMDSLLVFLEELYNDF